MEDAGKAAAAAAVVVVVAVVAVVAVAARCDGEEEGEEGVVPQASSKGKRTALRAAVVCASTSGSTDNTVCVTLAPMMPKPTALATVPAIVGMVMVGG